MLVEEGVWGGWRSLSLAFVKEQSHSLLGRLEGMGRVVKAAVGRIRDTSEVERKKP